MPLTGLRSKTVPVALSSQPLELRHPSLQPLQLCRHPQANVHQFRLRHKLPVGFPSTWSEPSTPPRSHRQLHSHEQLSSLTNRRSTRDSASRSSRAAPIRPLPSLGGPSHQGSRGKHHCFPPAHAPGLPPMPANLDLTASRLLLGEAPFHPRSRRNTRTPRQPASRSTGRLRHLGPLPPHLPVKRLPELPLLPERPPPRRRHHVHPLLLHPAQ